MDTSETVCHVLQRETTFEENCLPCISVGDFSKMGTTPKGKKLAVNVSDFFPPFKAAPNKKED